MSPQRIQRKRTKGWRMPEGAVYVGRPSKWGNPYRVERVGTCRVSTALNSQFRNREHWHTTWPDGDHWCYPDRIRAVNRAVDLYRLALLTFELDSDSWDQIARRDLACWCPLDQPCHADVLLEIANQP